VTIFNIVLKLDVSDNSDLELSSTAFLTDLGKTSSEIQDILYDGDEFQTVSALANLYTPNVFYSGSALYGIEVFKEGDQ